MIEVRGVCKRFGKVRVFEGLDTDFTAGRVTALVGANGSGKSTLIRMLLDLARPDQGTILVQGRSPTANPSLRELIGYMPQVIRYPALLTGNDLLGSMAYLRRREPDLSLVQPLQVQEAMGRPFGVLSGGTRQKVNAVLAFAFAPKLLLLDEPATGLDPRSARALKDRIIDEKEKGTTVILTSHVLPELEELAEDLIVLAEGKTNWSGSIASLREVTGESTLERALIRVYEGVQ